MGEYLSFKKLITPTLVRILFWLALVVIVLHAISLIFGGEFWAGIVYLLLGPVAVRVYCEILIVIFEMNNTLTEIRDNQSRSPNSAPPPYSS